MPPNPPASDTTRWFVEEVHPHDSSLKAYQRGSFPSVRDAEEVVQESYLRVWRAEMAGSVESARGFLFCAARNLAIDLLHRRRRSPSEPLRDLVSLKTVTEHVYRGVQQLGAELQRRGVRHFASLTGSLRHALSSLRLPRFAESLKRGRSPQLKPSPE